MADFEYMDCGLFVSLFPGSPDGERELARFMKEANDGSNKILSFIFPDFQKKAIAAGYTFTKAKNENVSDAFLLGELT